jgi:hypothetical protein
LKREGKLALETEHRQVKYLNNVLEADHGKLKLLIKPVRGFKSMPTAYATIKGFEVMRALRKGQARAWCLQPGIRRGASDRKSIWHWPLGHDRGHGRAQSAFCQCCLIPRRGDAARPSPMFATEPFEGLRAISFGDAGVADQHGSQTKV